MKDVRVIFINLVRETVVLADNVFRNKLYDLIRDFGFSNSGYGEVQLGMHSLHNLFLVGHSELYEHLTELTAHVFLFAKSLTQLFLRDDIGVDQQISKSFFGSNRSHYCSASCFAFLRFLKNIPMPIPNPATAENITSLIR